MMTEMQIIPDVQTPEERAALAGAWLRHERQTGFDVGQEKFAIMIREEYSKLTGTEADGPAANTIARWERGKLRAGIQYMSAIANVIGREVKLVVQILHRHEIEFIPED